MPDFSQLEYSDWLDTIALCITVAGIILGLIYSQILHSPTTRQRFIAVLQKSKVRNLYQAGVLWFLAFLQHVYGDKKSLRALNVSLLLAYLYPTLFFLFSYSYVGGTGQFSSLNILPEHYEKKFWIFLFVIGFSLALSWLFIHGVCTNFKSGGYIWVSALLMVFIGLFGLIVLMIESASLLAFIVMLISTVTGVAAILSAIASIGLFPFFAAIFSSIVMIGISVWGRNHNLSMTVLFFYLYLPVANALLDWLSWWISRFFMERTTTEHVSVRVIVLDVTADFIIAVLFMLILVLLLPVGAIGLDALYTNAIDANTGLTPQTQWQDYAVWARDEPWGKGIMVTLMLVTTLIPTLLHIFLGLVAFYIHAFKGQALAAFLTQANPEDNIANMQASLWVFGYAVLAGLSMWVLWLGLNQLFNLPIAQWLYAFAKFFYPLP